MPEPKKRIADITIEDAEKWMKDHGYEPESQSPETLPEQPETLPNRPEPKKRIADITIEDAEKWMKDHGYEPKPQKPEPLEQTPQQDPIPPELEPIEFEQPELKGFDYRKVPYVGQFAGRVFDAAEQGLADISQAVGMERAGNYLNDDVAESSARLPEMKQPELSLDYIINPNGMLSAVGQTVGSMLPMLAASRLVPSSIGTYVGGIASQIPIAGALLGKYLPGAVKWTLGATPVEALMEKGGTERDLLEEGYSQEEASRRSNEVFAKNLGLLTATNAAEGLLGGRILRGINASNLGGTLAGRLGGFAASAAGETALNAFEEGEQQGFQDMAMGKEAAYNPANWNPEQWEAAKFGVAGMAPLTLLGLPASLRGNRAAEGTTQNENREDSGSPDVSDVPNEPAAPSPSEEEAAATAESESANTNSGEGTTWIRQTEDVSSEGVQPETIRAIDALAQWFYDRTGRPLVVTSMTDGGSHQEGERGHYAGRKFDINDWGSGAEGTILGEVDGTKGSLTDEMIKYGQSLGLGMNWEGDHIDVSVLGDQWEGEHAGKNFGGMDAAETQPAPIPIQYAQDDIITRLARQMSDRMDNAGDTGASAKRDFFEGVAESGEVTPTAGTSYTDQETSPQVETLKARSASRTFGIPTKEIREARQKGTINQDFTRNTINDIVNQIAQQEAARMAEQRQQPNLPALLPQILALPPGQSATAQRTPTGGQMAATTADAISQATLPQLNFAGQQQDAGLRRIIQQIMERGNQNAQSQSINTTPARSNQAGGYKNQDTKLGQGETKPETTAQNQVAPATQEAAQRPENSLPIQTVAEEGKAFQNASQEAKTENEKPQDNSAQSESKSTESKREGRLTIGDHVHTKTGKKIPMAKPTGKVDEDTFRIMSTLAKGNDGYYNRYGRAFFFNSVEGRNAFVREFNKFMDMDKQEQSARKQEDIAAIEDKVRDKLEKVNAWADEENKRLYEKAWTSPDGTKSRIYLTAYPIGEKWKPGRRGQNLGYIDNLTGEYHGPLSLDEQNEKEQETPEGDIAAKEREAYKQAYDRMQKAAEDLRNDKIDYEEAKAIAELAYRKYQDSSYVSDARRSDTLNQLKRTIDEIAIKKQGNQPTDDVESTIPADKALNLSQPLEPRDTHFADKFEKAINQGAVKELADIAAQKKDSTVPLSNVKAEKATTEDRGGTENAEANERGTGDEGERPERTEKVSSGAEHRRETVSERPGTSEAASRRLEGAPSENGTAVSEDGDSERVRAGVSGETGRRETETVESRVSAAGRERGSESESVPVERGGRRTGGGEEQRLGRSGSSTGRTDDGGEERRVRTTDRETIRLNDENYHIDDPNALFGGTPKVRFARNKRAIEVFQQLEAEKRNPTQEEKDAMAAFTGWGSFGQQLFQGTYENPRPQEGWERESEWLRDALGKEDWEAAQQSIINAHYTSPVVVKSLWDMVRHIGFKGGRVLEPSMGVGNFFGMMPKDMEQNSSLFGVEMDTTTGGIAKLLYPKAKIQISPYQNVHVADGTYDLVIGNVPFGNISPADRRYDKLNAPLHDYFFLKGIDELRSGGIMIAITSKGTMDKRTRGIRMELAKKAELIDAYRFPTGAFGEYAGTDVVTDVLVLKKREKPLVDVSGEQWIGTREHETIYKGTPYTYHINDYFEEHPEKVLGKMGFGRSTGRTPGLEVTMDGENFQWQLDDMAKSVPENVYEEPHYDKNIQYVSNNEHDRIGTLQEKNGKLYVATGVDSAPIEAFKEWKLPSSIKNEDTIKARLDELKDLVKLREAYTKLEDAEKTDAPNMEKLRKELKKVYDSHVAKYCMDNGKPAMVEYTDYDDNNNKIKKKRPKLLEDTAGLKQFNKANEPNYFNLCALMRKDGKPATILTERVMRTSKKDISNPTIREALMIQRNNSMRIDVDEIAKLSKKSNKAVLQELKGFLFKTPAGDYQVKDQYLSGNVRRKLREAKAALANGDEDMKQNIEALQKVMPEDIPYYNITVGFGGTWIDIPYYKEFIAELVGTKDLDKIKISRNQSGQWKVSFVDKSLNRSAGATTTYGVPQVTFDRLVTHALNHTKPMISYKDEKNVSHPDEEAMQKAVDQIDKIRETFEDWLWKDEKRKTELAHAYNEVMNNTATPSYDGSFLDMAGMMFKRGDKPFNLRQHQINAIYRGLVNGSGIYAHEVGTGKTYTMGGLAMEARRFGIAKKPLILAHNANSKTVASDIQEMYPGAKVLYISGDSKNVKRDLMRVKNDDWDVIVMPHSKTEKLTLTEDTLKALAADLIAELEDDAYEAAKADGVDLDKIDLDDEKSINKIRSQTAKELVKARFNILEKIRKNAFDSSAKDAIPFEELGIDMIIVDESHVFKKPPFSTRMTVKGLQKQTSGNAIQLYYLSQYVQGLNNGKGIHLFTGTPITNTIVEMYHNMKYVMPNEMKAAGVFNFDDWFNSFAQVTSNLEYSSTGETEPVDRMNAFVNVAELRRMVGQYMDIVFAEDMPEFEPRKTKSGKTLSDKKLTAKERDYLINGRDENATGLPYVQVVNEVIPMNDAQKSILSMFMDYAKTWKEASKKNRKKIMLNQLPQSPLYTEGSVHKAAMDARLYNPNINVTGMDSKEARVIKNVLKHYNEDPRITQVIFMEQGKSDSSKQIPRDERGYPNGNKDSNDAFIKEDVKTYNLLKGIKQGLIEAGIPEKEIAVVDGSTKPDKKSEIAEKVKHAEIRVVIGSTSTLGTGVNMQDNLKVEHHIDAPWMPGDQAQRRGRMERQGNKWNTVIEYRYITEKLDGRRWQVLSTKQKFIKMFMKADENLRVLDGDAVDVSDADGNGGNDFEETLSKATGDPRFLRKAQLEDKVKKLEKSHASFVAGIEDAKYKLSKLKDGGLGTIKNNLNTLKSMQDKYAKYKATHPESFEIVVGGKRYLDRKNVDEAIKNVFVKNEDKINSEFKLGEFAGLNLYGFIQPNNNYMGGFTNRIRITDGEKTMAGFDSADTIGGVTQKLANIGKSIDKEQDKLNMAKNDIATLEKQVKGTFPREAVLNAKKKELAALEKDLIDNPVPPPQWLVEGAPVMADVIVDGKNRTVENYRIGPNNDSFYVGVKSEDGDTVKYYPWQEIRDIHGLPMITAPEGVKASKPYEVGQTTEETAKKEKDDENDTSRASIQERVNKAVNASEDNLNLATQFGGTMQDGRMTFNDTDNAMRYLDAVNSLETAKASSENRQPISFSVDARIPHQSGSGTTQVAGTKSMYVKALRFLRNIKDNIKSVLDYGAGLGLGTDGMREANADLKIDSFEPDPTRWKGKTKPTYTDNTKIKGKYDAILNTNVLNVVEPQIRDAIVKDIASLLNKDGVAIITTRGWKGDIALNKNFEEGNEPKPMWVNKTVNGQPIRVYQKGFDGSDLIDYVSEILGYGYDIRKVSGFGKSAVVIRKTGSAKYSANTEAERMRAEASVLPRSELNARQRHIQNFGREMGVPVIFVNADPRLHGWHESGITYLNAQSEMSLEKVYWHETFHWLRNNNSGLYDDLINHIARQEGFSGKQLEAYRDSVGRYELTDAETIEEMLADSMQDAKERVTFMKDLAKENRSLAERFISWLREIMDRFVSYMNNPDAGLTNAQKKAMGNWLTRNAKLMVDGSGRPIFRVTPRGEIRRVDGTPLPAVAYSFAGEDAKTANMKNLDTAIKMAKSGKSAQDIFKETGWLKGKDGRWRFEIPDLLSKIDFSKLEKRGSLMLERVYDNPKLYEAYPFLKKIRIELAEMDEDDYGQAWAKTIQLNKDMVDDAETKKTLVHEIQHMIQKREGFADGGNPESVRETLGDKAAYSSVSDDDLYWRLAGEQEAREVERRAEYRQLKEDVSNELADAEKAFAAARKSGSGAEIRSAKERLGRAKQMEKHYQRQLEKMPTPHGEDAIIVYDDTEIPVTAKKATSKVSYSVAKRKNSFARSIRNIMAGLIGDGTARVRKEMKDALEAAAGMRIRSGHIGGNSSLARTEHGIIVSRYDYDWEAILPEAGKAIAKRLDLDPTEGMGAYIGNWLLNGALKDSNTEEAYQFQTAMRNNPGVQYAVLNAQETFQKWNNMEASERIKSSVQWTKRGVVEKVLMGDADTKDELAKAWHKLQDDFVEELLPFQRQEEELERRTGEKINFKDSAYKAFRMLRGNSGRAMNLILGKNKDALKYFNMRYPSANAKNTFRMILDHAGVLHDAEGQKDFGAYCLAKDLVDVINRNRRVGMEAIRLNGEYKAIEEQLKEAKDEEEQKQLKAMQREIREKVKRVEARIMPVPHKHTEYLQTVKKFEKRFGKAQRELVEYSRAISSMLLDSGVISKERYDQMQKAFPNYVPLYRVFDENENIYYGDSLKEAHGSTKDIINPFESIMSNTFKYVRLAEKNEAKLKLANLAKMSDVGDIIRIVDDAKPNDKTVVPYLENGQKRYIQTDPAIVTAINNMGEQHTNTFFKILTFPSKIARATFTTLSPSFAFRNVFRDVADAYLYGKHITYSPLDMIADFYEGLMSALSQNDHFYALMAPDKAQKRNELFYEWMASGAAQASIVSTDRNYMQSTIDDITMTWKDNIKRPWKWPGAFIDILQAASEYSEYATRIAVYKRTKNEIAKSNATISAMDAITQAAYESRDLMDFARSGPAGRSMNQLFLFSNASVQGWDKFFRTMHFEEWAEAYKRRDPSLVSKEAKMAMVKLALTSVLPTILLFMLNHDKDWWKEMPDWQKELHWLIKIGDNTILRIPKGMDPGIQFMSNLTEIGLSKMHNNDPIDYNRLVRPLINTMPELMPTTFMPYLETYANYSFFTDRSIVPQYQRKLPAKMQYGPYTSSFAKWMGEKFNLSPRKIDHLISNYTGQLGRAIADLPNVGKNTLDRSIEEWPVISGILATPFKNPKTVQEYYDKYDEQEKLYNEYKSTRKKPEGYNSSLHARMRKVKSVLAKLSKAERALMNNPNILLAERKERQTKIQERRVEIMRRVLGR